MSLAAVAGLGLLALVMPGFSDVLRRIFTGPLTTLHASSRQAADRAAEKLAGGDTGTVPAARFEEMAAENDRLAAQVVGLQTRLRESEEMVRQLRGLRGAFPVSRWSAVPVQTVSRDSVPTRESVLAELVRKPSRAPWDRIAKGQWATARLYAAVPDPGGAPAVEESPVFWDQTLIGRVESVAGGWCRVKLTTDPDFQSHAEIVNEAGELISECVLVGKGGGLMAAKFVEREKANVAAGDTVRIPAGRSGLPAAVVVGRVSSCKPDAGRSPLLDIEVAPVVDVRKLETVLILTRTEE